MGEQTSSPSARAPLAYAPLANAPSARVLIGGVGYRWMSDASFGVVASDALAKLDWPPGVKVDDLGYGALLVAQDLSMAAPPYDRLILLAAVNRGRLAGQVYRTTWSGQLPSPEEVQERIREAGAGVVDLDHLLVVGQQLGALPPEVVIIEVEPVDRSPGTELSPELACLLPEVIELVRREAALSLADRSSTPPAASSTLLTPS